MKMTLLIITALLAAGLAQSAEPSRAGSLAQACAATSEAGFSLSKDNLGEVLANLGLRPEKVNEKRYRMQIDRGGIKFTISSV